MYLLRFRFLIVTIILCCNVACQSSCKSYRWVTRNLTNFSTTLTQNSLGFGQGPSNNPSLGYSSVKNSQPWVDMFGVTNAYWYSQLRKSAGEQAYDLSPYQFVQIRIYNASSIWSSFKIGFKACQTNVSCVQSDTREGFKTVTERDFERVSDTEIGSTLGPDYLVANIPFASFSNSLDYTKATEMQIFDILPVNKVMTIISIGFSAVIAPTNCSSPLKNSSYVTVQDGSLFLEESPLAFVSFNSPNLLRISDAMEQEDLIKTIAQFANGSSAVTRPHVIGTVGNNEMIFRPYEYSATRLANIDRILALANKYKVKLILPFIDYWELEGGIPQFISLHGITGHGSDRSLFYTNITLIDSFKHFIGTIINRTNTVTGIRYIDDTSILAWELGNELLWKSNMLPPTSWLREISNYIKSLDPNHLVMDGSFVQGIQGSDHGIWTPAVLQLPSLDIYSMHFNGSFGINDYANRCKYGLEVTGFFRQNLVIGKHGLAPSEDIMSLINDCQLDGIQKESEFFVSGLQINNTIATSVTWALNSTTTSTNTAGSSSTTISSRVSNTATTRTNTTGSSSTTISSRASNTATTSTNTTRSSSTTISSRPITTTTTSTSANTITNTITTTISTNQPTSTPNTLGRKWSFRLGGTLLWSLRGRKKDLGFYGHSEGNGFYAYHYPGFPANANSQIGSDELVLVPFISSKANSIAISRPENGTSFLQVINRPAYSISPLEPPTILSMMENKINSDRLISFQWFGSVGATMYRLNRTCTLTTLNNDTGASASYLGLKSKTMNEFIDTKFSDILSDLTDTLISNPTKCPFLKYSLVAVSLDQRESDPAVKFVILFTGTTTSDKPGVTTTVSNSSMVTSTSSQSDLDGKGVISNQILYISIGAAGGLLLVLIAMVTIIFKRKRRSVNKRQLFQMGSSRNMSQFSTSAITLGQNPMQHQHQQQNYLTMNSQFVIPQNSQFVIPQNSQFVMPQNSQFGMQQNPQFGMSQQPMTSQSGFTDPNNIQMQGLPYQQQQQRSSNNIMNPNNMLISGNQQRQPSPFYNNANNIQ